jgi:hypothetical protein
MGDSLGPKGLSRVGCRPDGIVGGAAVRRAID